MLAGCLSAPPALRVTTAPADLPLPTLQPLPDPAPIKTLPVHFKVRGGEFILDARGYENLARNGAETLRWILEARHLLGYYHQGLSR